MPMLGVHKGVKLTSFRFASLGNLHRRYTLRDMSIFPVAVDEKMVGEYPAEAKSGGGYFYDDVLEYRVWCRPWLGAPDVALGLAHQMSLMVKFTTTTRFLHLRQLRNFPITLKALSNRWFW